MMRLSATVVWSLLFLSRRPPSACIGLATSLAPQYPCLRSSSELLSPQFPCAILLLLSVGWVPVLGFPFHSFLSCAWFTCLFLLVGVYLFLVISPCAFFLASQWLFLSGGLASSLPGYPVLGIPLGSLGALLPRSNLRFPPRRGPPFGSSQLPIGFYVLLSGLLVLSMPIRRLCVGRLLLLSCSSSSLSLLYRWVFSSLGGLYYSSSLDLPSGVGSQCLLRPSVVFPGGVSHWSAFCSLLYLRFLPAVPPWYCFCYWWPLPSLLSVLVLPALG